jgi:uncharacterized protein YqgC (DUF456 family)
MTDWLLLILAILVFIIGFIGCFLPVLPGPPVSFVGMIILHFSDRFGGYSTLFLLSFGLLALVVQILDYIVPAWGTKKFGGTKHGTWGSIIGLIFGIFILPSIVVIGPFGLFGIILGPFVGALIGETMAGQKSDKALRAAFGSFIGFLGGTLMKLVASVIITVSSFVN